MNLPPEEFISVTEEAELEFGGGKDSEMTNDAWRNWAAGQRETSAPLMGHAAI